MVSVNLIERKYFNTFYGLEKYWNSHQMKNCRVFFSWKKKIVTLPSNTYKTVRQNQLEYFLWFKKCSILVNAVQLPQIGNLFQL